MGASRKQHETLKTLGLGTIGRSTERDYHPTVRGLAFAEGFFHLVVALEVKSMKSLWAPPFIVPHMTPISYSPFTKSPFWRNT